MKYLLLIVVLAGVVAATPACSICNPDLQQRVTFRQDVGHARLILYGTVANARLGGAGGGGSSDLHVKSVLKSDPWLGQKTVVEVPRYVPIGDPKNPPRYLLFCDVADGRLDILRGPPVTSDAAASYVKGLLTLQNKPVEDVLRYCYDFLEHPDKEIAEDAFLEFAKASDQDVGKAAARLDPKKLRAWIQDPKTPEGRLGVYAFLLGSCGGDRDAALLEALLKKDDDRTRAALDGLLAGLIRLRPRDGWTRALALLGDERKPFPTRYAVLRTLRFYRGWKPEESKAKILEGLASVLRQSDLADMAVEDLRRWQEWDLSADVLKLYGAKGYDAPLMQRTLVRYALTCPKPEAQQFVRDLRGREPDLVKDVEEGLTFEKR